ncbi:RNA polymerase sigma factor [Oscillibacter sp. GMB15532]|uniref:RNA polymerase sigma factor n=1 Tax=Oscillibacter sp. GMB15532 TaxID=3230022 RepID=UPI0034DEF28A
MIPQCILVIEDDDDRAFMSDLVKAYERIIYSTVRKITTDCWDVDEIYQITWVRLIDKIPLLRSQSRDQRVNYLISTAHNTALNYLRDSKRPKELSYEDYMDTSDFRNDDHLAERYLVKEEELAQLSRVWSKLDERSRYILEGYYILERPMDELAQELGIKPSSIRMALTRARKAAYALLEKEEQMQK